MYVRMETVKAQKDVLIERYSKDLPQNYGEGLLLDAVSLRFVQNRVYIFDRKAELVGNLFRGFVLAF